MRKQFIRAMIVALLAATIALPAFAQSKSTLRILCSESGAQVLINGGAAGIANPALALSLNPGTYQVTVQKSGFWTYYSSVTLGSALLNLYVPLSRSDGSGVSQTPLPAAPAPVASAPAPAPSAPVASAPPAPIASGPASGPHMVRVPAGTTSSANGGIKLDYNLEVGAYEVTNAEFLEFLKAITGDIGSDLKYKGHTIFEIRQGNAQIKNDGKNYYIPSGFDKNRQKIDLGSYPAMYLSWYGAIAYCNWLSEKEGLPPAYDLSVSLHPDQALDQGKVASIAGYRLPLAREWEYAARGGSSGKPTAYAGSDSPDTVAWHYGNSMNAAGASKLYNPGGDSWAGTMPVGKKAPNELGLHDMSGNVSEWCNDRSVRGGDFVTAASDVKVNSGTSSHPEYASYQTGFRVVRTAIGSPKPQAAAPSSLAAAQAAAPAAASGGPGAIARPYDGGRWWKVNPGNPDFPYEPTNQLAILPGGKIHMIEDGYFSKEPTGDWYIEGNIFHYKYSWNDSYLRYEIESSTMMRALQQDSTTYLQYLEKGKRP